MKMFFNLLLIVGLSPTIFSQITINNTLYAPTQLVNGVLVPVASGTTISNVTFSGVYNSSNRYQVGYFSTATTTLAQMGFSSGVVLSTGNTSDIPLTLGANPQAAAQMSTGYTSCTAGELRESGTCLTIINDLNVLAGATNYYNGAILEFDFVPVADIVQFRYIFGSEEYTDNSGFINYQCSSFNDKFGFLISGPGIAGGQGFTNNARNIARLANGSQVSINSVNGGTVGSSGGAPSASNCQSANPGWVQNVASPEYLGTIDGTELNGNTKILTAEQTGLTPGQTYHIKLIITDVGDAAYDAVVYLEAGSFTTVACTNPNAPTIGTITQPTCTTPTGTVALSALPAVGNWTVIASPGGATITGSGTTGNFSGLTPSTTYTFTVTNEGGCTSVASANAAINAIPSNPTAPVIGTITQPSCLTPTGSVNLSGLPASGSWTVTASPGAATLTGSGTTGTFTGLTSNTTYTFTVTNSVGCTSPSSSNAVISLYTPTPPVVGTITQPTCTVSTGNVALSGLPSSGAWTVTASPGGATLSNSGTTASFTGLAAGSTYTFTVTDNLGCVSAPSGNAVLNAQPITPPAPVLGTVTQPTCLVNTGTVQLTSLPAGSWTINTIPGGTTSGSGSSTTISGLAASASYTFTVVNSVSCVSNPTGTVNISAVPTAPTATVIGTITQPSCLSPTGSVDLSGLPTNPWTVTASPGGATITGTTATATFSNLNSNTTYTFTVTENGTACTSVSSSNAVITLYTPTPPVVGAITQPTCGIATGSVDLSGLPTPAVWTITATPGGATLSNSGATATFNSLTAGQSYTFTVTDNSGCISAPSSAVVINPQPLIPSAPAFGTTVQPTCLDNTGSIELTGLPSGNWTITSTPGGTTTGTGSTLTITGLTASTSYTYTVLNDDNCTSSTSATLNISGVPAAPSAPVIGNITDPTCALADGSVELSNLPSSGNWTINSTPAATSTTGSGTTAIYDELAANTSYTFTITDENGCTSLASASASIGALPTAPTAPVASTTIQPTCTLVTGTIEVTSPIGVNYQYSVDGITYQSGTIFSGLTPSNYDVFVQDMTTSCISSATSLVVDAIPSAPAAPVLNIVSEPTCIVMSGEMEITAPIGSNYEFTLNGLAVPVNTYTFPGLTPSTAYSVTVTDLTTGCTSTAVSVSIGSVPAAENVDAGPDYTIQSGESVTLTATGNGTIVWDTGDATATTVSPTVTTTYTVTLTDGNGCVDTDMATVTLSVDCGELFIPTAFSPNSDAANNTFSVKINADCVKEMDLKVYDRWGEVVFSSTDPSKVWDGKYKGKELDAAVFVYVLEIMLDSDTEKQKFKGNLTLIK